VISGNGTYGVFVTGPAVVRGNTIGPDVGGTAVPAGSTQRTGVHIDGNGSTIGGAAAGAGNVISGHSNPFGTGSGIEVLSSRSATIQGNTIGLNTAGTASLANDTGIDLIGSTNVQIGGTAPRAGNIISGNARAQHLGRGQNGIEGTRSGRRR
jgi:hypothetical protein